MEKVYTGWLEENEEWLSKKKGGIISSIRPNLKVIKTIDKGSKRSFTTKIKENSVREIIQEREI